MPDQITVRLTKEDIEVLIKAVNTHRITNQEYIDWTECEKLAVLEDYLFSHLE